MSFSPNVFAALQLGAGIFQSIADVQQGQAEAQAQEYSAGADLFNAGLAETEAGLIRSKAKIEVSRKRRAQGQIIGEQQALYAASGVRVDSGTPLVVMKDTLEQTELDILLTEFNAKVDAERSMSEARQSRLSASQRMDVAGQTRTAGYIRGGKTLLESVGTFASKFPQKEK